MSGAAAPGREVYGLLVRGLDDVDLLPPVESDPAGLTALTVGQEVGPPGAGPGRTVLPLADGRSLVLDRAAATAVFHGPLLPDDLLAHPYLAAAAREWNRWAGRDTFHGGAFVHAGRAFVVCGPREAGKSSLLAGLAAAGVPVLADDLAVIDDGCVCRGPRSIDLRGPVPGVEVDLQDARRGTRRRMRLGPVPPAVPLGGWFFLRWGDDLATAPVPAASLLARLVRSRSRPQQPSDPVAVLSLAGVPGWDLRRPRDWALLGPTVDLLLRTAAAAVPGGPAASSGAPDTGQPGPPAPAQAPAPRRPADPLDVRPGPLRRHGPSGRGRTAGSSR